MSQSPDIELGREYKADHLEETEHEALLSAQNPTAEQERYDAEDEMQSQSCSLCWPTTPRFGLLHIYLAFLVGIGACIAFQFVACGGPSCFTVTHGTPEDLHEHLEVSQMAPPYVGSTERHQFPPTSPTNAAPTLFPTDVGYAGGTLTGAEPALVATAPSYPLHTGAAQLVAPESITDKKNGKKFDLFKSWGNLSPWFSVGQGTFGVHSSPEPPETCRITGLHLLHRHGARYPTASAPYGGPATLAGKLHATTAAWNGTGDLDFLNDWTYKLGEEVLTPFGRQQLFDLGISMRLKYGFLLKNFTDSNTIPVFRTESQDRMLASAQNFAIGFFGYPLDGKYQQSITIEERDFNNTLAPYKTCPNARAHSKADRSLTYVTEWASIYLKHARRRLSRHIKGYDLTIEDTYRMQQMCAYETVALGYSKFCELFTEEEWEGFNYSMDLTFWYDSAFGSPVARVQGVGYVQELVARLTHTPIQTHNSSTNATLDDDPTTFPLDQSLYVDATHEVVVLNIITALNLTSFAKTGPLPATYIPKHRSFKVAELAPFATNMQFQLLSCTSVPGPQIRIILNDGVVPLTGIKGCPKRRDGMCPVKTFVAAQKETISETDWIYDCYGDWKVLPGSQWNTTTGSPPKW